jgi:DNA modification methylase
MQTLVQRTQGTVFDPFMGSGSTGVACAIERRPFVGVEIDRRWFDVACDRIEKAQAQGQMFAKVGAGDTAVQGDMLLPANQM